MNKILKNIYKIKQDSDMSVILRRKLMMLIVFAVLFSANNAFSQLYTSVTGTTFCAGSEISVSWAVDYAFNVNNVFTVQLSSSTGSFANPVVLGTYPGRVSSTVNVATPTNTGYGTSYRIRTIASDPQVTGTSNGSNLTINPLPTPSISGNFSICDDNRTQTYTTPSVSGVTYQWTITGGSINGSSTSNSVSVTWSGNSGTLTISETFTATGCTASSSQNTIVNSLPNPSISGNTTVCASSTQTYTAPTVSGVNYQWSATGGSISGSSTNPSVSVTWGSGTTGSIRITETISATGCTASSTQNININPLPNPTISGTFSPCYNSTSSYSTSLVSGNTYQWVVTGGTINGSSSSNSVLITWNSTSGSLSLTETITATGCNKTVNQSITINPLPTPSISGTFTFCDDNRTQTYSTPSVSGVAYQWSVSGGTINGSSSTNTVSISWSANSGTVSILETISATGCTASTSRNINVNPIPNPSISGTFSVCATSVQTYSTPSQSGNTYQWSSAGGTISGSSTSNTVSVTWSSASTGSIRVVETIPSTGCATTRTQNITINPLPTPSISGIFVFCSDQAIQNYTTTPVTGVTYNWTVTGGTIVGSSSNNTVRILWQAASGSVRLTETVNATLCAASSSQNITMNYVPNPQISGTFVVCADNRTQTYVANYNSNYTYNWTVDGGTINSNLGSTINITIIGSSCAINLQETDIFTGCTSFTSANVIVNPLPTPDISGNTTVCATSTQTYSTPSVSGVTYQWSVTGGTINGSTTNNQVNITWSNSLNGTVTVREVITATGCEKTVSKNIIINALPPAEISGNFSICTDNRSQVYNAVQTEGDTYQWSVTGGSIVGSSTTYQLTVNWTANTGSVNLTEVVTETGCSKTTSHQIVVNPLPNPNISGNFEVCRNRTEYYQANENSDYSYNWSVNGGSIVGSSNGSSVLITWGSASGSINLVETINSTGCTASTTQSVIISDGTAPDFTGALSVCEYTTHNYSTPSNPGRTYQWSVEQGTINGSSTANSVSVSWNNVDGSVKLTETNTNTGCTNFISKNISVNPLPTLHIEGNFSLCADSQTQDYSVPEDASKTFVWSITGGTINGSSTNNQVNVTWTQDGGYLYLTETVSNTGCSGIDSQKVYINSLPTPEIDGSFVVCANSTENYSTPNVKDVTYQWSVMGGSINGSSTNENVSVSWTTEQGSITLVQVIEATGCSASVTTSVLVNPLPSFEISGDLSVCAKSIQTYTTPEISDIKYFWEVVGGTIIGDSTQNTVTVNWGSGTNGKIKLTESVISTGCTSYLSYDVTINPLPTPAISGLDSVCLKSIQDYSTGPTPGVTYNWVAHGGTILGSQTLPNISVRWTDTTARLILTETILATGCVDSIVQIISINLLPTPVIAGNFKTCALANENYSVAEKSGNQYVWTVTHGTITGSNRQSKINVNWTSDSAGTLSVIQTVTATGCVDSAFQNVRINPLPTPTITGTNLNCVSNAISIPYTTPTIPGRTNRWSVMGGTIDGSSVGNQAFVFWLNAGNNSITVTQTVDSTGCSQSFTYYVTVKDVPKPFIKGKLETCVNTTETYSATYNPTVAYAWTANGGNIIGKTDSTVVVVNWVAQDQGTLKLQITDNTTGCKNYVSQDVTLNRLPKVNLSGVFKACSEKEYIYSLVDTMNANVSWTVEDGTIIGYKSVTSLIIKWDRVSYGKVTAKVTNKKTGCVNSQTFIVNLFTSPKALFSGPTSICQGTKAVYTADTTAGVTYAWDVYGSQQVKHLSQGKIEVTWTDAVTGKVSLTAISGSTCTTVLSQDVKVFPAPQPIIIGDSAICQNVKTTYTTNDQSGLNFKWTVTNGSIVGADNSKTVDVIWTNKGQGTVSLSQTFAETACLTKISKQVEVYEKPAKPVISQSVNILNSSSSTGNQWFENGTKINGSTAQSFSPNHSGEFSVQVINANGCVSDMSDTFKFQYTGVEDAINSASGLEISGSPNPAIDKVIITYRNEADGILRIELHNVLGIAVKTLELGLQPQGQHTEQINVNDLSNGTYFISLKNATGSVTIPIVIIK